MQNITSISINAISPGERRQGSAVTAPPGDFISNMKNITLNLFQ